MGTFDLMSDQALKRQHYLDSILASGSPRKIIVAGPGTGKTHTFGVLLRSLPPDNLLALTFIRKLVADMDHEFGDIAEVKTFHGYCKMLLHLRLGAVDLIPFLTDVIEEDANAQGLVFSKKNFDNAFQTLQEDSPEVAYYLKRGNYYRAVSFDDSVFRVYQAVNAGTLFLPVYGQIVIDEFQDFNRLEIALIDQLRQNSPILIVGDDDQAVYEVRNASPDHLRNKYLSGEFQVFELPYCSRCPRVVVEATTAFVDAVLERGGFTERIPRPFVPYLEGKTYENETYPKVLTATTANIAGLASLIRKAISKIPEEDVREAHDQKYPCVLIVGQRQYLNPIHKILQQHYPHIEFAQTSSPAYSLINGYQLLLEDENSNLGWRLLAGCELTLGDLRSIVSASHGGGSQFSAFLPDEFLGKHKAVLEILRAQNLGIEPESNQILELLGDASEAVIDHFFSVQDLEPPELELAVPTILLSSFQGCKGLSAGHVFIVGLNEGEMPRPDASGEIPDIEYCKFIVALTRTRKSLFLLSNRYEYKPPTPVHLPSIFVQMIPAELRRDGGYLKAVDIDSFLNDVY
jgi:superfamily I DNA/RNA helicase